MATDLGGVAEALAGLAEPLGGVADVLGLAVVEALAALGGL